MTTFRKLALAVGVCAVAALGAGQVGAQTTDGFHTIQIFPVVVDSASFAQRFTFRNPNSANVTISVTYFPGTGTSQAVALSCGTFIVNAGVDKTFASLRTMCPGLAAGSQFGYVYTYETNSANLPYSGYSRVSNPQGNGFSVEAFAASEFTSANATVTGIRRQAATVSNPTFQTNCFVGNVNDITAPVTPITTDVSVSLYNSANTYIGGTTVSLTPGKLTRLLDVFAAASVPAGDYLDARAEFTESGTGEPGIMAFCTVQDNTSFGADFRVAKQEYSGGGQLGGFQNGPQDDLAVRNTSVSSDVTTSGPTTRTFEIGLDNHANTHVVYFRHPDWIQCELINPSTGLRALAAYGLEMRMLDGNTVIAGGDESYGFGEIYLGDKTDRNEGANTRYTIEVESTAVNHTSTRPYRLHCQSGSGHTGTEIVRYQDVVDRF